MAGLTLAFTMRSRADCCCLCLVALALLAGCRQREGQETAVTPTPASRAARLAASLASEPSARPLRSADGAALAVERELQVAKLRPPPQRAHEPRLAFGAGVVGQLTANALRVYDSKSFESLAELPLAGPRALLALPDGALLAVGANAALRWQRGEKPKPAPRPMLLPGAELYADAQQADLLWVFDHGSPPTLSSFRLAEGEGNGALSGIVLPEQRVELVSPRGGVFGVSREGVWLYLTPGHVERFSPGGLKLPGLSFKETPAATWLLPTRRLDQSLWLDGSGALSRVLVSPSFKRLQSASLGAEVLAAAAGDEGRLLAAVVVSGPGPRFELQLFDAQLQLQGRAVLPLDAPTGKEDWVRVVTQNQTLSVAPRQGLVAVGGPARLLIFDAAARQVFPK